MSVFKCKMCGGTLEINENQTTAICDYCGTKQTLPKITDERRANLYDRANHFRRNNDFDKAEGIYNQILNDDSTDAEAYWSLVLCRYGIEYVEDPSTHRRVPTVNRAQFTSVYDDVNYKSAIEHADSLQKTIYEAEANVINEIQKGILAISQKEEPFDVFICYKETDANGRRTPDSVLANDLYHQLTQEGFKVFFSRITLEDKLGTAYEPYIFAALNSAKVMVVLGTKQEYYNAVWVKNEWSRYLSLVKQSNGNKILIPAYKDMDPYDLPEEFSHLQAQDMSKLGFMQDLIRGIKKLTESAAPTASKETVKETVVINNNTGASYSSLLERAFMFLEDGDFNSADEYCEKVLDMEPKCAEAYLGKLMVELKCKRRENLKNCEDTFDGNANCQKAIRFGDDKLKTELEGCNKFIQDRNEADRLKRAYAHAVQLMKTATSESAFLEASDCFEALGDYENSKSLASECRENAVKAKEQVEIDRKDKILADANLLANSRSIYKIEKAITLYKNIPGWKNADEQVVYCENLIKEIEEEEYLKFEEEKRQAAIAKEKKKKQHKKIAVIAVPSICIIVAFIIILNVVIIPNAKYNSAISLMNEGKYTEAIDAFTDLDGFRDSKEQIENCNTAIQDEKYSSAVDLMNEGKYSEAIEMFTELDGYKDSKERIEKCEASILETELKTTEVGDSLSFGKYEQDGDISNGKENIEWQVLKKEEGRVLVVSKYILDYISYNTTYTEVTWETCSIRNWLNTDFVNDTFGGNKDYIESVRVTTKDNTRHTTKGGNDTIDKVFVLSVEEVNEYLPYEASRVTTGTRYVSVSNQKTHYRDDEWMLRTPASEQSKILYIRNDGDYGYEYFNDKYVDCECSVNINLGVRPAMWISIN